MARVLEDDPENKALSRRAFVLFLGAGQVDKAIEIAELMEERESGMTTAFLLLAARDVKEGAYTKAQERLKICQNKVWRVTANLWQAHGFRRVPAILRGRSSCLSRFPMKAVSSV